MFVHKNFRKIYHQIQIFSRNEQGAIAIIFGLLIIPILGFFGLSIDLGNVYYVQSVIGGAVDAAALAGGRSGGTPEKIKAQATAIFNANIPKNLIGSISAPTITLTQNNTVVKVTATGTINNYFLTLFGISTVTTSQSSVALVTTKGAEVVLALDNTGSMDGSPMQSERDAASQLVNILYGGNGTSGGSDTIPGLSVAVVPYSTTVNISGITLKNNVKWLSAAGQAQVANTNLYPNIAAVTGTSVGGKWMGCIEARAPLSTSGLTSSQITAYGYVNYPNGTDTTDATPTQYPFSPFLYPSTMIHQYVFGKPLNRGTTSSATTALETPPWGSKGSTRGDNDWRLNGTVPTSTLFFGDNYSWKSADGNYGVGPNLGCPVPMTPLQTSQTVVQNTIKSMLATFRGGTMINLGLNAAWWTISPNWNGTWAQPTPAPVLPNGATLPQAYNNTLKVVVLMTDGQNQWYDWPTGVPGLPDNTNNYKADADYTGYGRLAEGRSGTTVAGNTGTTLNARMTNMCTTLKNNKVVIYTIIFTHGNNIDSSTQKLFQNCATDTSHYYFAPDNATLLAAFQNIGQQITKLRLGWAPNY